MAKLYSSPKIYTFRPQKESESFEIPSKVIWFLLILVLMVGIIYFFLFSSYFKIENIYIVGAGDYETDVTKIINNEIAKKSNIFLFPDKIIESRIAKNYSVFSRVQIYKGFPDALKVVLDVRKAVLVCSSKGTDYLIDSDGVAFKGDEDVGNLPKIEKTQEIEISEKAFTIDFVAFIQYLWEHFPQITHLKIEKIIVPETDFVIEVYNDKKWKAIFDTTKDCQKQLANLALILPIIGDQKIEYVDIRLEEKIYYK